MTAKETRLNLRISSNLREQIETLAHYHGLTMSSYVHSLLVKAIRKAVTDTAEAFDSPTQNDRVSKGGPPLIELERIDTDKG